MLFTNRSMLVSTSDWLLDFARLWRLLLLDLLGLLRLEPFALWMLRVLHQHRPLIQRMFALDEAFRFLIQSSRGIAL